MRTTTTMGLLLAGSVLVAACGGGTASMSPDGIGAVPGQTDVGDGGTSSPAPTTAEGTTPTEAPADGGGSAAGDVCALVTPEEMAGVFGVPAVTQELFAGPPDTCDYQVDGAPQAALVLTTTGALPVFDAMAADPGAQTIPGLGDRAVYSPSSLILLILKGDRLLTIAVLDESNDEAARLESMKAIGAIAAGRM